MRLVGLSVLALAVSGPVLAQQIGVPSGQDIRLHEVVVEPTDTGETHRYRFVAPDIAGVDVVLNIEVLELDMVHLCHTVALPEITENRQNAERVIISFSDRPTEFAVANPDVTQLFESYRIVDNTCQWEAF